ncbi:MAG: hypothetical protein ACQEQS_09570 [Thermodesulfobacteriota bacterium]
MKKFVFLLIFTIFFFNSVCCFGLTTFTPGISVKGNYTDNYNQTESELKEDDYSTQYSLDFSLNSETKRSSTSINYSPSYVDSKDHDEDDSINHIFNLNSLFNLTKHSDLGFNNSFEKSRKRALRTGTWEDTNTFNASVNFNNRFDKRSTRGGRLSFTSSDSEGENADDHQTVSTGLNLSHWFSVRYGYDAGVSAEKTMYDSSQEDKDTYKGNIKFSRKFTKHLNGYIAYNHSLSIEDSEEHTVYNPSAGFDWEISKTSKFSLGAGVLFHDYSDQKNSNDLFVNADIFKLFDFSKRGSFTISATSGYEETNEDAASLGFNIYYQGGCNFNYRLTKRLSWNLSSSYKNQEFKEADERTDNTLNASTGLNWTLLRWLNMNIGYTYTNFQTDSSERTDYEENTAYISFSASPARPSRMEEGDIRKKAEKQIYGK